MTQKLPTLEELNDPTKWRRVKDGEVIADFDVWGSGKGVPAFAMPSGTPLFIDDPLYRRVALPAKDPNPFATLKSDGQPPPYPDDLFFGGEELGLIGLSMASAVDTTNNGQIQYRIDEEHAAIDVVTIAPCNLNWMPSPQNPFKWMPTYPIAVSEPQPAVDPEEGPLHGPGEYMVYPGDQSLIGKNLRRMRHQFGYTLVDASAHLGISVARMSNVENGKDSLRQNELVSLLLFYVNATLETHKEKK